MIEQIDTRLTWPFIFVVALCAYSELQSSSAPMNKIVITNKDSYRANGYTVDPNPWGAGNLVNGTDYSQTITLVPATFPNDVQMDWHWKSSGERVMAYPHIKFIAPARAQAANFAALNAHYALTIAGDLENFNVSFELWFASGEVDDFSAMTHELMIMIHVPGKQKGNQPYTLSNGGLTNATVYVNKNWGNSGSHKWTFIVIENSGDKLGGTINLGDVVKALIWNGELTGREYINGVQLGAEVSTGIGGLTIHQLDYEWNAKPSIIATATDHIFNISAVGGNHIVADADLVTAIYSGSFSAFKIQRNQTETLIMRTGDISSLDVLEHAKFIQFSDGRFDVTAEKFDGVISPR
jgi:hypothetical protein